MVSNIPFTISQKDVLREFRIPEVRSLKDMPDSNVAECIKTAMDAAYTLINGKGIYRTFEVKSAEAGRVNIPESESIFFGKNIAGLLKNCSYVTLLACTIGPELEARVEELKGEKPADAYFLEIVGGWMADYMAQRLDERIEREILESGFSRTRRYSPGYGDWNLQSQGEMVRLTQANKIGISLTETFIMIPRKSVTAAIGWVRN